MKPENYPYQRGDIVKCNYNFDEERAQWKLPYPKKGDYLIVLQCLQHDTDERTFMLYFDSPKLGIPLAAIRFDLVQDEQDGDNILNEAYKIANNF